MNSCNLLIFVVAFGMLASCKASCNTAPAPGGYASAPVLVQAPPCPKNYIFSCQPQLRPLPCASAQAASGGYGNAGSYSNQLPIYALPPFNHNSRPDQLKEKDSKAE
ncbi:vitelline membrane protein Vm32E-like [Haematobia irritans]|uniref:vitelline membrane protein Vm32E-like n=1 Tax=Haematobia irritans TaxID=7368 RepID=UPI003F506EC1